MNTRRDPTLTIDAFLDEGLDELPERSYDAVGAAIDETRQWAVVGPWKEPQIMTATRFAVIAAAIAVVAVVAIRLLPASNVGPGPIPATTASSTASPPPASPPPASPSPSPTPVPSAQAVPVGALTNLEPGRYVIPASNAGIATKPVTFDVGTGWSSEYGFLARGRTADLQSAHVLFTTWIVNGVYSDACHWQGKLQPAA